MGVTAVDVPAAEAPITLVAVTENVYAVPLVKPVAVVVVAVVVPVYPDGLEVMV
jgi:hypothetical protein